MPNIMIHEKVAYTIAKQIKDLDTKEFYLGALSPDAVNVNGFASKEERWTSHIRNKDLNKWRLNIINFYKQNQNNYNKAFLTGYLIHILTDIVFDDYFYLDVTNKIKEDNKDLLDPHPYFLKCMDEYAKENMTSTFFIEIKEKLKSPTYYDILNITKEELKSWTEKKLNEQITTNVENKYIDDRLISSLTEQVLNEYNKIQQ